MSVDQPRTHDHTHAHARSDAEEHDLGLSHDLPRIVERNRSARMGRRGLLAMLGGVGVVTLAGCASDSTAGTTSGVTPTPTAASPTTAGPTAGSASTASAGALGSAAPSASGDEDAVEIDVDAGEIPEETAGPFPADGSNGPDALAESGVVRSDLTTSFGDASGVAEGVPTTVRLTVYDLDGDTAAPLAGAAVYLWHCDRAGRYSMYDDEVAGENYLRGVQKSDSDGRVTFTTVFPGAYSGRWPHMHFEVYRTLADATRATNKLRTSQLALPEDVCNDVYRSAEGYEASVGNLARTSLDSDMVFSDGYSLQMARTTGSVAAGYTVSLNIPV